MTANMRKAARAVKRARTASRGRFCWNGLATDSAFTAETRMSALLSLTRKDAAPFGPATALPTGRCRADAHR
jgi:hypothetical protein